MLSRAPAGAGVHAANIHKSFCSAPVRAKIILCGEGQWTSISSVDIHAFWALPRAAHIDGAPLRSLRTLQN